MNGWISVDNALPQEPGRYLVTLDAGQTRLSGEEHSIYKPLPVIVSFHRGRGWFNMEQSYERCGPYFGNYVTHWMPLPDAAVITPAEN
jgi:hypothetical protein